MHNNKKLAMAAILAISGAAHADVTIYGFLNGAIDSAKATGNGTPANEVKSTTRVEDGNSRIGFKGDEDLGNGLKAIWQVENSLRNFEQGGVNDKGQSATFATRNTFVGLQSSQWGTFNLGYYDSAYKRMTDVGLNVLADTPGDQLPSSAGGVYSRRNARLTNSVSFTSSMMRGFQVGVSYGLDELRPTATNGTRQNDDRLDLAASYSNGGLLIGAGYDREGDKLNSAGSADAQQSIAGYKLAASYTFATGTRIGAGFERVKTNYNGSPDTTQNDWLVVLSQPITGAITLKAGYAMLGKLDGATVGSPDDYKAKQWLFGATYDLSKRTQMYAYASKINNNKLQNANFNISPVYSSGVGTDKATLGKGDDPQAIGIGLKTMF